MAPTSREGSPHGSLRGGAVPVRTGVKLVVASFCLACGICLFIESGLGSDPIDVLLDGLNRTFGISIGQANLALNIVVFIIGMVVNRAAIGVPSVIGALLGSLFADVVNAFIIPLDLEGQALAVRVGAVLLGQLALCGCYGIMQTIPHGSNISDAFVQWVARVAPGPYVAWRAVYDGSCLVIGYLLGGVFGVGTVFSVITTGAITRWVARLVRRIDGAVYNESLSEHES